MKDIRIKQDLSILHEKDTQNVENNVNLTPLLDSTTSAEEAEVLSQLRRKWGLH